MSNREKAIPELEEALAMAIILTPVYHDPQSAS